MKMKSLTLQICLAFALILSYIKQAESLSCYKCGQLSSSARFVEDCSGTSIVEECSPDEVCVVFKRLYKRGSDSIRGCFGKKETLPGINGIIPASHCQFQPERRSSVKACMCNTDFCNDKEYDLHTQRANRLFGNQTILSSKKLRQRAKVSKDDDKEDTTTTDFVGDVPDVECPLISVIGATYANCDGRYKVTNNRVPWARHRPVYKHTRKNRYIFWNAGGLGWSIGKREYLKTGSHWHRSGLDTDEPWQGKWEEGVRVECVGGSRKSDQSNKSPSSSDNKPGVVNCLWSSYGQWSRCSVSCGTGTEQRKRMILQPASIGGKPCEGEAVESRRCTTGVACSVNCEWSNFSRWSSCSTTCGAGRQTRRRNIRKEASGGGRPCSGDKTETRTCNQNSCSELCCERVVVKANGNAKLDQSLYLGVYNKISDRYNGRFAYEREGREQLYIYFFRSQADNLNLWVIGPELGQFIAGIRNDGQETCIHETVQEWKYASRAGVWKDDDPTLQVECFSGKSDTITTSSFENQDSTTTTTELPIIRNRPQRVDCEWSSFGEWSPCSKSCGRGIQFRTRRIAKTPKNGGANCVGSNKDTRSCNIKSCNLFTTTTRAPTTRRPPPVIKEKPIDPNRRVKCFACGSLFSTNAPPCDKFDVSNPQQQTSCGRGEACLWYSYQKSAGDVAIIRECFSTSILLGSIENPIKPSQECVPRPVENNDSIMACICASDYCNGYDEGRPVNLKTTTTPSPFRLPQSQTERPRSQVGRPQAPSPNQIENSLVQQQSGGRVLCHQCGSLFSGSGNPPCEEGNPGKTEYCQDGEACLWYSWKKSNIETSIIRECFSKSILLGSIDKPLQLRRSCSPQDISETRGSNIFACLCDTDRCNANGAGGDQVNDDLLDSNQEIQRQQSRIQTTTRRPTSSFTRNPKPTEFIPPSPAPPRGQNTFSGGPGLQCYNCGSLLNPDAKCDKFNPSDPSQIQTCKSGEACLLYKWKKSSSETAILRECFSKSVLLGSFDNPLLPTSGCNIRDISEPQSSSIEACLCTTDFCNDDLGRGPGGEAASNLQQKQTTRSRFADTTTSPIQSRFTDTTRSPNFFDRTTEPPSFFERTTQSSNFFDQNSRASTPFRPNFNDLPDELNLNRNDNFRRTSCPTGYTLTSTGCYKISQRRMGWIEAKKRCESENGNLAAIDSEEERSALLELISKASPRTRFEYWLGGNDIEIENRWVWTGFGNAKLVPDFGWLDRPVPSEEENCLTWSITLARKGSRRRSSEGWHSDSCCNDIRFICELK